MRVFVFFVLENGFVEWDLEIIVFFQVTLFGFWVCLGENGVDFVRCVVDGLFGC